MTALEKSPRTERAHRRRLSPDRSGRDAHFSGVHLDLFQRVIVSPASVTVFELGPFGAALVKCNDTGSLDELVPKPSTDAEAETDEAKDAAGDVT
jgi:hypothetical protein